MSFAREAASDVLPFSQVGGIVINIAVWGAVVAYIMQMISFIVLRRRFPNAVRPYKSPTGIPGAVVAGVIALAIFQKRHCAVRG